MKYQFGDVVLCRVPFHRAIGDKIRPSIVLVDSGDADFVGAPLTTRLRDSAFDITIEAWKDSGLNTPSSVRIHKLTVLPKALIIRSLGSLTIADRDRVGRFLIALFSA